MLKEKLREALEANRALQGELQKQRGQGGGAGAGARVALGGADNKEN